MKTAVSRVFVRVACVLIVTFFGAFSALAQDAAAQQQLRASADEPSYMTPFLHPMEPQQSKHERVVDKKFISMSMLAMGLTIADIEKTQHCLGEGSCRELNPMLPHSRAGMYAVNVPINALAMFVSYRLKEHGHKTWWLPPVAISVPHAVGAGFTF